MALVYLIVSIVCVTGFALCYKVAARYDCELRAVNLCMNIAATAVLVLTFVVNGRRFNSTVALLGLASGACTYLSTLSFFYHMRSARLAVSWTVIGLAVVFPVAASILVWHEQPSTKQWFGLGLLPVALLLLSLGGGENSE